MLELRGVSKSYGAVQALRSASLTVEPGEIVALAGPSGAGKTTLLHVSAGILAPSEGEVHVNGIDVTRLPAWRRNVAIVQETYALYPHFSVFDNIAFPLRSPLAGRRVPEAEIASRIADVAEMLGISAFLKTQIQHLSGGQRQRVGLARALVREPEAFLLDEPIAHLDAKLRHWLRGELRRRLAAISRPTIWATPDGKEALAVADKLAILVGGRIVQFDRPKQVFLRPATARVAEIVSEPPITLLRGSVDPRGPRLVLEGVGTPLSISPDPDTRLIAGDVLLGVRPSTVRLAGRGNGTTMAARVLAREFTTRETLVSVRLGEQTLRVTSGPFSEFRAEEQVNVDWVGASIYLFDVRDERKLIGQAEVRSVDSDR